MERTVADLAKIDRLVSSCGTYWRETGVPAAEVGEMAVELRSHLEEARAAGKSVESVIGESLPGFAEAWAAERRPSASGQEHEKRLGARAITAMAAVALAVVALTVIYGRKEDTVDNEVWRWIFLAAAFLFTAGEMVTAGFFLLPFAIGAGVSTVLAFAGVAVSINLLAFLVVSLVSLVGLQRFARRDDEQVHPVGANRYVGRRVIVIEPVSRIDGTGRVRLDTEIWRATTDLPFTIDEGTESVIKEVRGTRLVIEPAFADES
jgi:membrane protein implicated in regulation of membrane protease activity